MPLSGDNCLAQLTLYPVTANKTTVGIWTAEFDVIWTEEFDVANDDEAGVIDAVGNGTFDKAFEVLHLHYARPKQALAFSGVRNAATCPE